MRGRKPKPTELKLLQGVLGKRRLPSPEQRLRPTKRDNVPSPPSWVCSEGKKFWKELAPDLYRLGILTVLDEGTLAVACNAHGEAARAQADINRLRRKRPRTLEDELLVRELIGKAMVQMDKASKLYKSFLSELGLSATSRTRIEMSPVAEAESRLGRLRDRATTRKQA